MGENLRKILIVDDIVENIQTITRFLEESHPVYRLYQATGGSAALNLTETISFDLIISDIRIPEKNGTEIVREIQSALAACGKKELPIIFITGYAGEDLRLNASFLGETIYKPIDIDKLLTIIRDYL